MWAQTWRSGDSFRESVLSFSHVGLRGWTLVTRLGNKYLYPLGYLASSIVSSRTSKEETPISQLPHVTWYR